MKKVLILSTFLGLFQLAIGQEFKISFDPVIRDASGTVLSLGLSGGLNQPQFSNMDFNNDGKQDLFVYDRTGDKVLVFISQTTSGNVKYFYDPMYEEYIPNGQEFMRLVDYNNDGKPDLWLYDRAKSDSVKLYQNNTTGLPQFDFVGNQYGKDNVSGSAQFPTTRIGHIVGSLPSIVDVDSDGDIDFVTILNPGGSQLILFCNNTIDSGKVLEDISFEIPDKCYGQIDEDNGELVTSAFCFFHENYKMKKHEATKTIQHFDADNDGDMDLFYGSSEELTNPFYFLTNVKSDFNYYKDTFTTIDTAYFPQAVESLIPSAPSFSIVDIDLDGINDLVLAQNETVTGSFPIKQTNNVLYFRNFDANNNPDWQFVKNDFLVGDMLDLGAYTSPTFADIDNDGDQDLFIATNGDHAISGDSAYTIVLLENIGTSTNPDFQIADEDFAGLSSLKLDQITPQFVDVNSDGLLDLVYGMADGTMQMHENEGSLTSASFGTAHVNYFGLDVGNVADPYFYDIDNDGDLDLFMGSFKGTIEFYENENDILTLMDDTLGGMLVNPLIRSGYLGTNGWVDTFVHQSFGYSTVEIGELVTGDKAFFLGGDEGKIRVFKIASDLTAEFEEITNYLEHPISQEEYVKDWGRYVHPGVADLNGDSISDVMIGNDRGGVHYLEGLKTVSVRKLVKATFSLFPNPTTGRLRIEAGSGNRAMQYDVLDVHGRIVQTGMGYTSQSFTVDSNLENGVYFLSIRIGETAYQTQKFILMR